MISTDSKQKLPVWVIKIGGNIVDDEQELNRFLISFAGIKGMKILVHGGGKLATRMAEQLNIPQQMIEGRRITDAETLKIVTMVYAGYINKNIVAGLQARHCNAIGLCGADANIIGAVKRTKGAIDYGFAGDVTSVDATALMNLMKNGLTPVIAPITHNGEGQLLNTNADTIAQSVATALAGTAETNLVYSFEKSGVLRDAQDEESVITSIDPALYDQLKKDGLVFAGMIPKLDNAFNALRSGVSRVIIGKAQNLESLLDGTSGTTLLIRQ